MYRNVYYNGAKQEITLFTWDSDGLRTETTEHFKPFFYIEDPKGTDGKSVFNTPLKKIEFDSVKKRREYGETLPKTFYNIAVEQQYLISKFNGLNKSETFATNPLKIFTVDIEVYSKDEFPKATEAKHPINLISIHDSISNTIRVFGLKKDYYPKDDNVFYNFYDTEIDMLKAFLRFWRKDFPDIVTGWYSDGFDIPYICNRLIRVFDDRDKPEQLSPVGNVYRRTDVVKRLQTYEEIWSIGGITLIDYQYIYKVFTQKNRENYTLDLISSVELGETKLKHNAVSLSKLMDTDWDTFVDYNIQDVNLVVKLEAQLQYLSLCKSLAYSGLSPIVYAESTIGLVTGVAAQKALETNKIIHTYHTSPFFKYAGGYVKIPKKGITNDILYFDANSLYPNTIVTINSSPETKLGKMTVMEDGNVKIVTVRNTTKILSREAFDDLVKKEDIAVSEFGILFTQKVRGIFPSIIEEFYSKRVVIKSELKRLRKEKEKLEQASDKGSADHKQKLALLNLKIKQQDMQQYTIKIFLNRIYGYFGVEHCPMMDIDIAASITLTGQSCIKTAADVVKKYIDEKYGVDYDPIVASDTDSVMITIEPVLKKLGMDLMKNGVVNPDVYRICEEINELLDEKMQEMATGKLNSKRPSYEFKRENITRAGLFIEKKRYVLNIVDDEGIPVDEFIYKGVEVVRTFTPKKVKPLMKSIVENIILSNSIVQAEKEFARAYEIYNKLSLDDIANPMGLNNYKKYLAMMQKLKKFYPKTPRQVRAAITYNRLREEWGLDSEVEELTEGQKIRIYYCMPNDYGLESMIYTDPFPDKFREIFQPNYKKMFERTVYNPIHKIFETIDWDVSNPMNEEVVNLIDLFRA